MAEHHPEPKPIPTPDNFPITWDDPADAHLPLNQDRQSRSVTSNTTVGLAGR
jgi:hypothetical protein